MSASRGWVALVGAGPGDPGLLTLRGAELLDAAHVVLVDRLVGDGIRARIPIEARIVEVGKQRGGGTAQDRIVRRMIDEAAAGRRVVRLKGGDPFVFGRGGEEAIALAAAGLDVEVVAGVTSAIAGPASIGVPVTHRGVASSVCILTAEETRGARRDWRPAVHADTVVLLMGLRGLAAAARALIDAGKDPGTPAIAVADATRPTEAIASGTLATIAARVERAGLEPPALVVVGHSVAVRDEIAPGMTRITLPARPLAGVAVLVTRPEPQAPALADALRAIGAEPVLAPAIRIEHASAKRLDAATRSIANGSCAWVVATSANGVRAIDASLARLELDARAFAGTKFAAIGPATAEAFASIGVRADLVASDATVKGLARAFPKGSGRVLLPRADRADPALGTALARKGWTPVDIVAYRIKPVRRWPKPILSRLESGSVAAITLASAETASAVADLLRGAGIDPASIPAVAIGAVCARGARDAGFSVRAVATQPTIAALAACVADVVPRARRR